MYLKFLLSLRYLSLIFFLPITIIFGIFIKIIKPILIVRWSHLINTRIGHYLTNPDLYLLEKKDKIQSQNIKYFDIFYKPGLISCNKQIDKMWSQKLNILPWFLIYPLEFLRKRGLIFSNENTFKTSARDINNLIDTSKPNLKFSNNEILKGEKFLESQGLSPNDRFVCLMARDEAYLNKNYEYHYFRNANIENYKKSCEFLNSKNIFVFRMGKKVKKKISFQSKKTIDYANSDLRNDFLDIYLGSKCLFWLSTGSGIDSTAQVFRKPIAYTNQVPIGHITTYQKNALVIFKHYFDSLTHEKIKYSDLIKKNLAFAYSGDQFIKNNIYIKDNSENEILELTKEMISRIENSFWSHYPKNKDKQVKFWQKFPYIKELHGTITSNIGKNFIDKNENLIS
ncbi:TIGR04372 family glycosyltransferase [Candidatus Pelagibacter bacterium]|nr:TIGR04372 family glycosyltransferase [Candidatus Pelagibacter bacterium]MDA9625130.1 TIGR04372 family glycosyltransferase [Candidatus Pelagibacter bacterium]